jgi:hypothetical protein
MTSLLTKLNEAQKQNPLNSTLIAPNLQTLNNSNKKSEFSRQIANVLSPNMNTREKLTKLFESEKELFWPIFDLSLKGQKEMSQERLKRVLKEKLVSVFDFESDPNNIFTYHEMVICFFIIFKCFIFILIKNSLLISINLAPLNSRFNITYLEELYFL